MTELIFITLVPIAAVVAWVWFRRRTVSGKPLARDRRSDEQPPLEDEHADHRTDVGMHAPVTTDERQEQSIKTPHEPTIESSDRDLTDITVPSASKSVEPASSVLTAAVEVGASLLPSGPSGESGAAVAIEPVGVLPIPVDVSCPPSNETIPHQQGQTVRTSEENHARSASPPIASFRKEDMVRQAEAPVSQPPASGPTTSASREDAARACETATQPGISDEEPTELLTSRAELIVHPLWANNHPTVLQARAEATDAGITQFQTPMTYLILSEGRFDETKPS